MDYGKLGNITFTGLIGFDSLTRSKRSRVVEIPLLDTKSRVQKTGDELTNISFSITVDRSFGDPDSMVLQLDDYRDAGTVLDLSDGNGLLLGRFVLISTNETFRQLTPAGEIQTITIAVELKEFFDPNPVATSILAAGTSAFALERNGAAAVQVLGKIPTPMAEVSSMVTVAGSGAESAFELTQKAEDLPTQRDNIFLQIKGICGEIQSNAQIAIENLQNVAGLAAKAPMLLESVEVVKSNANALETSAGSGDLTNSLINADVLIQSSVTMATNNLPLDLILITRAPQ